MSALRTTTKTQPQHGKITSSRPQIPQDIVDKIDAVEVWMKQKRYQQSTISTYLSFIKSFFSFHPGLEWNRITSKLITTYNYEYFIKTSRAYSTQNQWINAIKLYLKVHHLDIGGLAEIERPRKQQYLPDILSTGEIKTILQNTPNLKHRSLLMLIYSCGLRIGEALALRPADIRSEEGLIYIRGAKGNKDRRVPLSPRILEQLRLYYNSFRPQHYLFEGQKKGDPYSSRSAAQVLKRAVHKSGITKKITLHTLRHSYATHITNKGVNIQYLQEILGHNSPKTTMIYTHLSGKDIREVRSPLDDLDI
jgi:integrase/recombinase XerD